MFTLIRDAREADQTEICEVHRSAFAGEAEAELVDELCRIDASAISLVAECDAHIAGHVLFSAIDAPVRALALAPVGVVPDCQSCGIGSALIREGLRRAEIGGWEAVFVLGDPTYYARFGFSVEAAKNYVCRYAGDHFMAAALHGASILRGGRLIYPAPFARLD